MVIPVRKPIDHCPYTEDAGISGSQWIKTPSILLYKYLGYNEKNKEGEYDLPHINRNYVRSSIEKFKPISPIKIKGKTNTNFRLPTDIPYLNVEELVPIKTPKKVSIIKMKRNKKEYIRPITSKSVENNSWNEMKKYDKLINHHKFRSTYSNSLITATHLSEKCNELVNNNNIF